MPTNWFKGLNAHWSGLTTLCVENIAISEIGVSNVFRIDPTTEDLTAMAASISKPVELVFTDIEALHNICATQSPYLVYLHTSEAKPTTTSTPA